MSMSYANMIENRRLKKTFVTAITVSAILSCLTSAQTIHEHIKLHRQERARKKMDKGQEGAVQKMGKDVKGVGKAAAGKVKKAVTGRDASPAPAARNSEPEREVRYGARDVDERIMRSQQDIGREFEYGVRRGGARFAEGDTQSQIALQNQVIALQQNMIHMLQDMHTRGQAPTQSDYAKLLDSIDSARFNSIDALRGQSQRMLEPAPRSAQKHSSGPAEKEKALPKQKQKQTEQMIEPEAENQQLYCGYSLELQRRPDKPLSPSFSPRGSNTCPSCNTFFDLQQGRAWRITKDLPPVGGRHDRAGVLRFEPLLAHPNFNEYHVLNRFVVKCHREQGNFACLLCHEHRAVDTVWADVDSFVRHLQRGHDMHEYEFEHDILEVATG